MKKRLLALPLIVMATFAMIGADFRQEKITEPVRKHCSGYSILEAGLGIDCHGDTVKLIKRYGYYEIAPAGTSVATR